MFLKKKPTLKQFKPFPKTFSIPFMELFRITLLWDAFCYIVSLQVGTALLAVVCLVISALSVGLNAFDSAKNDSPDSWHIPLIIVIFFAFLMATSGVVMFLSAYFESEILCYVSTGLLFVTATYWMICTGIALRNTRSDLEKVCVKRRCGESFWLAGLDFHPYTPANETTTVEEGFPESDDTDDEDYETLRPPIRPSSRWELTKKKRFVRESSHLKTTSKTGTKLDSRSTASSLLWVTLNLLKIPREPKLVKRDEDSDNDDNSNGNSNLDDDGYDYESGVITVSEKKDDSSQQRSTLGLVGVIFFILVNAAFFIHALLHMLSYANEINDGYDRSSEDELYNYLYN